MDGLIFDPEPDECKQSEEVYNAMVRNLSVNFASVTGKKILLLQMIQPANIYSAVNDHTYSKRNVERQVLRNLNVSHISAEEVKRIELMTRGQSKTKEWKLERVKRLQSS